VLAIDATQQNVPDGFRSVMPIKLRKKSAILQVADLQAGFAQRSETQREAGHSGIQPPVRVVVRPERQEAVSSGSSSLGSVIRPFNAEAATVSAEPR
jgi:hypothetical protein